MKITAAVGLAPHEGHYGTALPFFDTALHRLFHLFSALRHFGLDAEIFCHSSLGNSLPRDAGSYVKIKSVDVIDADQVLSGRPDVLFVWNGASERWLTSEAKANGTRVVYSELGWLPQHNTIALDFEGSGPLSSFVESKISSPASASAEFEAWRALYCSLQPIVPPVDLRVTPAATIFAPLQMETDSNMNFSPFRKMQDFVNSISDIFSDYTVVVRPHPHQPDVDLGAVPENVVVRRDGSLAYWFQNCRMTVGLNSTVLIEALVWRSSTVALARSIGWNKEAFVYEGVCDREGLRSALSRKPCTNSIDLFIQELIFRRQISMRSLYNRNSMLSNAVLGELLTSSETAALAS